MFKYIMNILPRLGNKELNDMEKKLGTRFARVAKKFAKGMGAALAGGGVAGAALAIVDKILNPLKEVQEAVDKALGRGDDLVTNAAQFGTTPGKLAKLEAYAGSKGLESGDLSTLIQKFQVAIAEAIQDPTKDSAVRNYVKDTDMAESFFEFIQSLQKMSISDQVLVQQQVFGEKQILKMSSFLNADMDKLFKRFGKISTAKLDESATNLGGLKDLDSELGQERDLNSLIRKGRLINEGMIYSKNRSEKLNEVRLEQKIAAYQSLATITDTVTKMFTFVEKIFTFLPTVITTITDLGTKIENGLKSLKNSRVFKFFSKDSE